LLPRPRAQEVIELDATCEVVDEPDQAGEGALDDQLEPVRRGEPRGQGSADYRRVDRSTIEDQGLGERIYGGGGRIARLGPRAHRLDAVLAESQSIEDGAVESDAVRIVDCDTPGHAGDQPVDITAQELHVEASFPADEATAERWSRLARH
jgi:hypothetical protein